MNRICLFLLLLTTFIYANDEYDDLHLIAHEYLERDNHEMAIIAYTRMIELMHEDPTLFDLSIFIERVDALWWMQRHEEAIDDLTAIIEFFRYKGVWDEEEQQLYVICLWKRCFLEALTQNEEAAWEDYEMILNEDDQIHELLPFLNSLQEPPEEETFKLLGSVCNNEFKLSHSQVEDCLDTCDRVANAAFAATEFFPGPLKFLALGGALGLKKMCYLRCQNGEFIGNCILPFKKYLNQPLDQFIQKSE